MSRATMMMRRRRYSDALTRADGSVWASHAEGDRIGPMGSRCAARGVSRHDSDHDTSSDDARCSGGALWSWWVGHDRSARLVRTDWRAADGPNGSRMRRGSGGGDTSRSMRKEFVVAAAAGDGDADSIDFAKSDETMVVGGGGGWSACLRTCNIQPRVHRFRVRLFRAKTNETVRLVERLDERRSRQG